MLEALDILNYVDTTYIQTISRWGARRAAIYAIILISIFLWLPNSLLLHYMEFFKQLDSCGCFYK